MTTASPRETETETETLRSVREFREVMKSRGFLTPEQRETALIATLRQMSKEVEAIQKGDALLQAAVLAVDGDRLLMHTGEQGVVAVPFPIWLDPPPVPGDLVRATAKGQIADLERIAFSTGPLYRVSRILSPGLCEVSDGIGDLPRVVLDKGKACKAGDRVILDTSLFVVAKNYGSEQTESSLAFTAETGVTWDDIAGQEDAKKELREALEGPVRDAALYKEFGKATCKGILLHGPPGNGKTMFAKAMASAVSAMHGGRGRASAFIYVKGPEVLGSYIGQSEGTVRKIVAAARDHHKAHGYPAIVCIDEGDAILGRRTDSKISMEKTIVPQFLAEMDGLEPSGALFVILTNRPDSLDPAVTREGRVDLSIKIPRPGKAEAEAILGYHLRKRLLAPGTDPATSTSEAVAEIFSHRHPLYMIRVLKGMDARVGLADFVSGSMLEGITDRATLRAIRRFRAGGGDKGVTAEDLLETVKETPAQLRGKNHDAELASVVDGLGGRENIRRIDPL